MNRNNHFQKINRIRKQKSQCSNRYEDNTVIVLMSTYNGEKYISEQVLSILNQDYQGRIDIYIRDDGSDDSTVVRARDTFIKWREHHSANRHLKIKTGKNIGVAESFLKLINHSDDASFYMFSDQDDVWKDDKVSKAVSSIKESSVLYGENIPIIHCTNYEMTDNNLDVITECALDETPDFKPIKMLLYNKIPGCCMTMNKNMLMHLKYMNMKHVMMHDSFALAYACYNGAVIYDNNSYIYHRIHDRNVVGTGHKAIVPCRWIVDKLSLLITKEKYDISLMADRYIKASWEIEKFNNIYDNDVILLRNYKLSYKYKKMLLRHPDTTEDLKDRTTMSIRSKIFFELF